MDDNYGATHYSVMKDGVTPQMFYKQITIHFNNRTTQSWWHYLSFANRWMGSSATPEFLASLKPISNIQEKP